MSVAGKIVTIASLIGVMAAVSAQAALAETGKQIGTTVVRPVTKKVPTKLSEFECQSAKGTIIAEFACNSMRACETQDAQGQTHKVCLSK